MLQTGELFDFVRFQHVVGMIMVQRKAKGGNDNQKNAKHHADQGIFYRSTAFKISF